jgi:F0F1-type ATP synthase assembly protein I/ribosomal protein L37AE/L43A
VILFLFIPVFFYNQIFHTQLIAAVAAVMIGFLTGLLTRRLIAKSNLFVQIFFPFLVLLICLVLINWITAGQAGFGWMHDPLYGSQAWGLIPLAAGTLAIVLTLLAWKKNRKKRPARRASAQASANRQRANRSPAHPAAGRNRPLPIPAAVPALSSPAANARSVPIQRGTSSDRLRRTDTGPLAGSRGIRVSKRKSRNNHLRLVGSEEHRCPYCLEIVEPNDPRGVVVCDICHAYHHKDCWDVTGRCQVPHQNNN